MNRLVPTTKQADAEAVVEVPAWTLVTSHGLVLLYLAAYPHSTMRTVSRALGITERRVIDVIKDLEKSNLLKVAQDRRRNHYSINQDACFRHPILSPIRFDDFLRLWQDSVGRESGARSTSGTEGVS